LIWEKFWFFFAKMSERGGQTAVDFVKYQGLFYKMTGTRPIKAVCAPDPTAGNGRRRGHTARPRFPADSILENSWGFVHGRRYITTSIYLQPECAYAASLSLLFYIWLICKYPRPEIIKKLILQ
jgi:hypothetical protein